MRNSSSAASTPHSWALSEWTERAPGVYPHTTESARYLGRAYRTDLINAGALVRVGRELVVIGDRYAKWLQKSATNVAGYEIAPNKTEAA